MPAAGSQLAAGLMAVAVLLSGMPAARADAPRTTAADPVADPAAPMRFDIPRLPLAVALSRFHAQTGQSLLYDDAIAEGRMAGPLQGERTPEAALRELLAGSGIVVRYTSQAAFMLMRPEAPDAGSAPAAAATGTASASASAATAARRGYYTELQARVTAALCGDPATMPGSYRLALNLWIDAEAPVVERVLLHPTGNERRDARIAARLTGLALASAPPAGLAQPIALLILPRQPAQTGDCRP
jgi:hypothetical protein